MTFAAQMRLGSLEVLAAMAVFGVLAGRWKAGAPVRAAWTVALEISDALAPKPVPADAQLSLSNGQSRVIGRGSQADLVVADPEVSRRHAKLEFSRGVLYLSDLGSSNGTFLNGTRVRDDGIELRPGDYIDVGNTRISVVGMEPASWT